MDPELYAELLKPIKDIEKNWKIDVNKLLSIFLEETSQTSVESIDFMFASSIIEGAANLWGQKVDNLVSELKRLVEMTSSQTTDVGDDSEKQTYARRSRTRRKVGPIPTLKPRPQVFADPTKVCEKFNKANALKIRSSFEDTQRGSTMIYSSISDNQSKTNFYDSLLNRCIITSGGIACKPEHLSLVHDEEDSSTANERIEDTLIEEDHEDEDHADEDHGVTQMDVDLPNSGNEEETVVEEFVVGNQSKSGRSGVESSTKILRSIGRPPILLVSDYLRGLGSEKVELINLDEEPKSWVNEPPKARNRCYITRDKIEKMKKTPLPTLVSTIEEFTLGSRGYGSLACQVEKRATEERTKKRLREINRKMKQGSSSNDRSQNIDNDDDVDDVESFFVNHNDADDNVESDDDVIDDDFIQVPAEIDLSRGIDDIFINHVDEYFDRLNDEAETNQLLDKVNKWENRVLPYLNACNEKKSLNVKEKSKEMLSKMNEKAEKEIVFSDLLEDDCNELSAKSSFVTLLHMLNDGSVDLDETDGLVSFDDIKIKLLDKEMQDKEFST